MNCVTVVVVVSMLGARLIICVGFDVARVHNHETRFLIATSGARETTHRFEQASFLLPP